MPAPLTTARRRSAIPTLLLALALPMLGGCAILEGPTPETPEREVVPEPEVEPELVPGGTAEENLPYFREVLNAYAATDGAIEGQPIVDAVTAAGFDRSAMQVSFDRTETGLAADNIFVSVMIGPDCLIGQVVASDRSVVVDDEAAIGPNDDICIIGETRPIDW